MAGAQQNVAQSFEAMIQADRLKKKHENLAQQMLGSRVQRTASPANARGGPARGSLASRVGVTKVKPIFRTASAPIKAGIDGAWTHDLHQDHETRGARPASTMRTSSSSRLERGQRIQAGLEKQGAGTDIRGAAAKSTSQMSIRGMAATGPWCVVASNFAAGTTAADIEAAMAPIGGDIISCQIVNDHPNNVMAEIVFVDRAGAENVIATFNDQKADGRLLYVYMKAGPPKPVTLQRAVTAPVAPVEPEPRAPSPKPASPRAPTPGIPDEDMMEVEESRPAPREDQRSRNRAPQQDYQDRRQPGRYQNGGYGSNNSYSRQDQRDYRPRDRDNRGGFYSDGYRGGDRGYRR